MPQLGSKKSRNGCRQCKTRRVKCDEQVPCAGCVKREEVCSFLVPPPRESSEGAVAREDWLLDLELMHQYAAISYQVGARESVVRLWRYHIPQQAFENPFLMHGLLAFTALHAAHLKPGDSSRYQRYADKHQAVAIESFRTILSSRVDPKHADALFALSAVLSLTSMARSCALSETATMDLESVVELFMLTKGIANMIHLSSEHIKQGPMAGMLQLRICPKDAEIRLPQSVTSRFEALQDLLITYGPDQRASEHCRFALTELEELFQTISYISLSGSLEVGDVSRWQVKLPMGYLDLIQARHPPALVILAFYAAAVTAIHDAWYTHNWAQYALQGISEVLGEDMQHWLEWPWKQVDERMRELGVCSPEVRRGSDHPVVSTGPLDA